MHHVSLTCNHLALSITAILQPHTPLGHSEQGMAMVSARAFSLAKPRVAGAEQREQMGFIFCLEKKKIFKLHFPAKIGLRRLAGHFFLFRIQKNKK